MFGEDKKRFHFGKLKINCIKNDKNNSKIPSDRTFMFILNSYN